MYYDDELQEIMRKNLDTRDKRFMFLRIFFPKLIHQINLEGSTEQACYDIEDVFIKHQMQGSLRTHIMVHFKD